MRYVHTNIAARDWKQLAEFYIKVFDCRMKPPERHYSGEWLDRATGLTDACLAGGHLILPGYGDDGPTLEIFTYETMADNAPPAANVKGYTHIAFEVEDVRETFALALENGGQRLGEVVERPVPGLGLLVFVYLQDPEGNIIEILSWKREEK